MLELAGVAAAGCVVGVGSAQGASPKPVSLFNGRSLNGWLQIENNAHALAVGGIDDLAAFIGKLTKGADPVSVYLRGRLQESVMADLVTYSPSDPKAKPIILSLLKDLNEVISGPSIYDKTRFDKVALRAVTRQLLNKNPRGQQLARLNKLLMEDAYPGEMAKSASTGWVVKDSAMASTGSGRGVIYTAKDYGRFRLMFTMRHVSGNPDHAACVLIFCARPRPDQLPLDALGGIQFQVPQGGHWDYRPGMNNAGDEFFSRLVKPPFNSHEWSRVEILADSAKGTARMAIAQPIGSKAVDVLHFRNPKAGKVGPIAWQMHNAGLFDGFKEVTIEVNPTEDELLF
jgi:Domain of Unknown Function (DUF1080)